MPKKENPGTDQAPGQENQLSKNTTMWWRRQAAKNSLPYIATTVSMVCSPSGKAGRFLDLLLVFSEGGRI